MEPSRFDDLTKALATATSRRQAFKTIAATTLGGILGLSGIRTVFGAPKCRRNGTGCDTDSQCCSNFCANGEKCACAPLQHPCTRTSQCCDTGQGVTFCANVCCNGLGGSCSSDLDCCGGAGTCLNSICSIPA